MELPILENGRPAGTLRLRAEGLYTVFEARLPPAEGLYRLWLAGGGRRFDLGLLEPRPEGRFLCRRLTRLELHALPSRPERALVCPAEELPPSGEELRSADGGAVPPLPKGGCPSAQTGAGSHDSAMPPLPKGGCPSGHTGAGSHDSAMPPLPKGGCPSAHTGAGGYVTPAPADCEKRQGGENPPVCPLRGQPAPFRQGGLQGSEGSQSARFAVSQPPLGKGAKEEALAPAPPTAPDWRRLPDGSLIDPARRLLALPWVGGALPAPAQKITVAGREYWVFRT